MEVEEERVVEMEVGEEVVEEGVVVQLCHAGFIQLQRASVSNGNHGSFFFHTITILLTFL